MLKDRYDNVLSTSSSTARDAYVAGVDHVLGLSAGGVESFQAAIDADPGFALAHVGLARAKMYGNDMAGARAAIAQAQQLTPGNAREAAHINAMALLLSGKAKEARAAVEDHVGDHPRDAVIAQLSTSVFGLIGFSGCIAREADLFAYTSRLLPIYGDDWWMMSMHALSLCEVGRTDQSLELMERSLAINPRNAHGAHFKSHALYENGETSVGLGYLTDWMSDYNRDGPLHVHLSWHVALWALQTGDLDHMWQLVDDAIAPGATNGMAINVVTDTAAILLRAELAGVAVDPGRWERLSDYCMQTFPAPGQSFVDMHTSLAHAKAGQGERLLPYLNSPPGFAGDLVAPIARSWVALVDENWPVVLTELTPVMSDHARLGGSRAQRDLLEFAWIRALVETGSTAEARRWIATRRPVMVGEAQVKGLH